MKFNFRLPGGGEIKFEREKMEQGRFETICFLIGGSGVLYFIYSLLTAAIR